MRLMLKDFKITTGPPEAKNNHAFVSLLISPFRLSLFSGPFNPPHPSTPKSKRKPSQIIEHIIRLRVHYPTVFNDQVKVGAIAGRDTARDTGQVKIVNCRHTVGHQEQDTQKKRDDVLLCFPY